MHWPSILRSSGTALVPATAAVVSHSNREIAKTGIWVKISTWKLTWKTVNHQWVFQSVSTECLKRGTLLNKSLQSVTPTISGVGLGCNMNTTSRDTREHPGAWTAGFLPVLLPKGHYCDQATQLNYQIWTVKQGQGGRVVFPLGTLCKLRACYALKVAIGDL